MCLGPPPAAMGVVRYQLVGILSPSSPTKGRAPVSDGRRAARRGTARARLLDAAARVFARDGYHAASVDEIVKAAGVTKGAVYAHFTTKQELFLTLLEERIDRPV